MPVQHPPRIVSSPLALGSRAFRSRHPAICGALLAAMLCAGATPSGAQPPQMNDGAGSSPLTEGDANTRLAAPADDPDSPAWKSAITDSFRLLLIQHGTRSATQSKTRRELSGPFFKDYQQSLRWPSTWGDGDGWIANYVGHPMQGAASGFVWVANDPKSRRAEFGLNRRYWTTRWRALAWSTAYSVQFEIGPFSEASIGNVGMNPRTVGWTDHVVTPIGGTALLVAEDALDKFVVRRLERGTRNSVARAAYRMAFNPARAFSNLARGRSPWHRDNRALRTRDVKLDLLGAPRMRPQAPLPQDIP